MSEFITIGLNKNRKSFKPKAGTNNKRNRSNPVTISTPLCETQIDSEAQHLSKKRKALPIKETTSARKETALARKETTLPALPVDTRPTTLGKLFPKDMQSNYGRLVKKTERKLNVPPPKEWDDGKLSTSIDRKRKLLEIAASTEGVLASRKGRVWTSLETQVFYDGLAEFGPDFCMISNTIPGKNRATVKAKYQKEEHTYPNKISEYMRH